MSTRMLIDAAHPEETRVTVIRSNRVEEFDFESATKQQLRGNIYLARVTRVEPSLQAAFVEYGGNRQGFLAFSEIHPDYYQIPVEDREALIEEEAAQAAEDEPDDAEDGDESSSGDDELDEAGAARRRKLVRRYKIQEVIKRKQVLLVQVVKEERGTKGAALTTYISLAGRYCVLMPNTARGGGVSRKISNGKDRQKLKSILDDLKVPSGMGCIIRTAGSARTKTEIKRDYDYLTRLWDNIRELTLESMAPALIYEEGNLIKRAIRDLYTGDIDEVLVEGDAGYRSAKDLMKMLMPSHARKVQPYKDKIPLFHRYQVESQLETMFNPEVPLKSGGYLVINPTEALVAIDVNSGKSTKERNVEKTAYKTNLEAAEEVARQARLRDLAGLIVIDFIDMEDNRNNRGVERRMKECLKSDRARLQVGKISGFGLMEMSRQRLRPGVLEASTVICPHCQGAGIIRSVESQALNALRSVEEEGLRGRSKAVRIRVPTDVALYILNQKRATLLDVENRFSLTVSVEADPHLMPGNLEVHPDGEGAPDRSGNNAVTLDRAVEEEDDAREQSEAGAEQSDEQRPRRRRRRGGRRRRGRRDGDQDDRQEAQKDDGPADGQDTRDASETDMPSEDLEATSDSAQDADSDGEETQKPRRRRGSRGGRRRRKASEESEAVTDADSDTPATPAEEASIEASEEAEVTEGSEATTEPGSEEAVEVEAEAEVKPKKAPRKRAAKKAAKKTAAKKAAKKRAAKSAAEDAPDEATGSNGAATPEPTPEPEQAAAEPTAEDPGESGADDAKEKPQRRRRGWWTRNV